MVFKGNNNLARYWSPISVEGLDNSIVCLDVKQLAKVVKVIQMNPFPDYLQ